VAHELMRINGSRLLSNTWKQELVVTEDGVESEVLQVFRRIKMVVPFDRIAQVNLVRGILTADLEVVNKGGTDNIVVRALGKTEAEKAKALIESRMREASRAPSTSASFSVADELAKLAELRKRGIINESEFQAQKDKLLK
jgi:putative oligomerization/nucleic acid binding protein